MLSPLSVDNIICRIECLENVHHSPRGALEHRTFDDHAVIDRINATLLVIADGFGRWFLEQQLNIGMVGKIHVTAVDKVPALSVIPTCRRRARPQPASSQRFSPAESD